MKKIIFLVVALLVQVKTTQAAVASYSYVLKFQFPATLTSTPELRGWYKGKPLDLRDHWCIIREEDETVAFSLVITPEIKFKSRGNNVDYLKRISEQPCKWYDLTLHIDHNKQTCYWEIEEKGLDEVPLRLPLHTIAIQTNPDIIDKVEEIVESSESDDSPHRESCKTNVINLPMIFIKKNLIKADFQEASIYPLMASIDLRTIHQEAKKIIRQDQALIVSMVVAQ